MGWIQETLYLKTAGSCYFSKEQCHVGKKPNLPYAFCLEHNILRTGFFSLSEVRIFHAVLMILLKLTFIIYVKGLRQSISMKIAFRIVALLRLYPSSDTPFPKSNLFGQHLHNSLCNCLSTYCLFKTLHLREVCFPSQHFTYGFIFHSI